MSKSEKEEEEENLKKLIDSAIGYLTKPGCVINIADYVSQSSTKRQLFLLTSISDHISFAAH